MKNILILLIANLMINPAQALELGDHSSTCNMTLVSERPSKKHAGAIELVYKTQGFELASQVGQALARKACSYALPFVAQGGSKLTIVETSFLNKLKNKSDLNLQFNTESFFAGSVGSKLSLPLTKKTPASHTAINNGVIHSQCGQQGILRLNSSFSLVANPAKPGAVAAVKNELVKITIKESRCN